jgi:hypothetical protein
MQVRLVSSTLKRRVDDVVGLSVVVDSRDPELMEFSTSVVVVEANFKYLKGSTDLLNLDALKTAIISGPIPPNWFSNRLQRKCPYLTVLIITGNCLIAQDFSGSLDPLPVFEHLSQVHISLTSPKFMEGVRSFEAMRKIKEEEATMKFCRKVDGRVQKNMSYLMNNLRSEVLKTFFGAVFVNIFQLDSSRPARWEHEPLYKFMEAHRHTLEDVFVPSLFSGEDYSDSESDSGYVRKIYQFPTKLERIYWSAGFSLYIPSYWKDLLLAQESLKKLALQIDQLQATPEIILPILNSVVAVNFQTLAYVNLHFRQSQIKVGTIDIKNFRTLEALTWFKLDGGCGEGADPSELIIVDNLNQLPRARLTTLNLNGLLIGDNFDGISFLEGFEPTSLTLNNLSCHKGLFKDLKYLLNFVKKVLRNRVLDELGMRFESGYGLPENAAKRCVNLDTSGLLLWLANLEACSKERPLNHRCQYLYLSDSHDTPRKNKTDEEVDAAKTRGPYVERERAVNLDFMELVTRAELTEPREQPFHISTKANSYTIWTNQDTKEFKILGNTESYSQRVNDMERIRFDIQFFMDDPMDKVFRPVSLKDLKKILPTCSVRKLQRE